MENHEVTAALKAIRTTARVGVREMARRLGVSPSTYMHYEDPSRFKARYLPMEQALKFADALGVEGLAREQILMLAGTSVATAQIAPAQSRSAAGFAEEAAPFVMPPSASDPVKQLFTGAARNPAAVYRSAAHLPDFDIRAGDVLVCEQARMATEGEIAIVTVADPETGTSTTLIRRNMPPWLIAGGGNDPHPLRGDEDWTAILYPVIGIIRGVV